MKVTGKHVIFSFVLLVSGFLISFSYQQAQTDPQVVQITDKQWEKDYNYRQQLIEIEQKNKDLRAELNQKKQKVQAFEENLAAQEDLLKNYVNEKKTLQMLTGDLPVDGFGVEVTLRDAEYIPSEANANKYMVHESHLHKVVNELLSSGASAVAINGQRLFRDSFIACVGPVISVDGIQHPAPFVISAIGNRDVLYTSLNLTNGVVDQLVSDNIEVTVQKKDNIIMNPRVWEKGGH